MTDDDLRRLLSDLDPMSARVPVEPVDSPQARHRLEQIMSTDQNAGTETAEPADPSGVVPLRRRRGATILAAAASVAVVALGTVAIANYTDGHTTVDKGADVTTLALTAPGGGPAMQMCMRLDAEALRPAPVALAGTVVSIADTTVTLDVDHWYKGGDADEVTISRPPGDISPALIPGVEFEQGGKYLVTAYDGTVNGCGFSGPATPELQKLYDEAFTG